MDTLKKDPLYKLMQRVKKTQSGKDAAPLSGAIQKVEDAVVKLGDYRILARSLSQNVSTKIEETILDHVIQAVQDGSKHLTTATKMDAGGANEATRILRQSNIDTVIGNVYEAMLTNANTPFSERDVDKSQANSTWDYPIGLGAAASNFQGSDLLGDPKTKSDAKTRYTTGNVASLVKKVKNTEVAKLEEMRKGNPMPITLVNEDDAKQKMEVHHGQDREDRQEYIPYIMPDAIVIKKEQ